MKKLFLTAFVLLSLVLVSQAQTKHYIGEKFGGGIVFDVTDDSLRGWIAETVDQGVDQFEFVDRKIKAGHSPEGSAFTDWILPTLAVLNKLYENRNIVGGFSQGKYWSSDHNIGTFGYDAKDFGTGQSSSEPKTNTHCIRVVRRFGTPLTREESDKENEERDPNINLGSIKTTQTFEVVKRIPNSKVSLEIIQVGEYDVRRPNYFKPNEGVKILNKVIPPNTYGMIKISIDASKLFPIKNPKKGVFDNQHRTIGIQTRSLDDKKIINVYTFKINASLSLE